MIAAQVKLRVDAKHPRVTEELREQIVSGRYPLGSQLPHRDELEIELGASRATVQTSLNTLLREGFLRSISGKGTFVSERPPFVTDLGLLFPMTTDRFAMCGFYSAIRVAAGELVRSRLGKLHPYYGVSSPTDHEYGAALSDCKKHRIAGLIFAGVPYQLHESELIHSPADLPRVALQESQGIVFPGPSVYPDLMGFYRRAFERCKALGRKRVAVVCADRRVQIITEMAIRQGLRCPTGHVIAIPPEWSETARSLIALLFALPPSERPDALVIGDDNLVTDATAGLLSLGLKIPAELTVIAHANLPLAPKSHVPCEFLAFDAAQVVQACIDIIEMQRRAQTPPLFTMIEPILLPLGRRTLGNLISNHV